MTKMKSVYDMLLPDVKTELQASARKYSTAKRLKYTLMSKIMWPELSVYEVRDLLCYAVGREPALPSHEARARSRPSPSGG